MSQSIRLHELRAVLKMRALGIRLGATYLHKYGRSMLSFIGSSTDLA